MVIRTTLNQLAYCPVRLAAAGAPDDEEPCTSSIGERKWNPGMEGFVACHFKRLYNRRIFRLFNAIHAVAFLSFHMTNDFVVRIRVALWQWFGSTALFHIAFSLSRSNEIQFVRCALFGWHCATAYTLPTHFVGPDLLA